MAAVLPFDPEKKRTESNGFSRVDLVKRWSEAFDAFWAEYPRKVGKPAARRAWAKLTPETKSQFRDQYVQILRLTRARTRHEWLDRPPQKRPHAATFLHKESFEKDDVDEAIAEYASEGGPWISNDQRQR